MAGAAAGEHVGILGTELSCTIDHTKVDTKEWVCYYIRRLRCFRAAQYILWELETIRHGCNCARPRFGFDHLPGPNYYRAVGSSSPPWHLCWWGMSVANHIFLFYLLFICLFIFSYCLRNGCGMKIKFKSTCSWGRHW